MLKINCSDVRISNVQITCQTEAWRRRRETTWEVMRTDEKTWEDVRSLQLSVKHREHWETPTAGWYNHAQRDQDSEKGLFIRNIFKPWDTDTSTNIYTQANTHTNSPTQTTAVLDSWLWEIIWHEMKGKETLKDDGGISQEVESDASMTRSMRF